MTGAGTDIIFRESRAARRLGRLFRVEAAGGFRRRPTHIVRRLIERRDMLIEQLLQLDVMRRSLGSPRTAALEEALEELASNVSTGLQFAHARVEQISGDLRMRHGEGLRTGIRNAAVGQLLGRI